MALGVFSKFYYGFEIDFTNNKFDFNEGSGELNATITIGTYTPQQLAEEIKIQLDAVGTKTYTVTFSRSTRKFTIAASSGTYQILISTGANAANSIYETIGFTGNSNLTGAITYTADSVSGSEYSPQFWLQDYSAPGDWIEKYDASVNSTATGEYEVISFGDASFVEFNILFITNKAMDNVVIKNNPNGVSDANDFMGFAIKKGPVEFMPDQSDLNTYYNIVLESTPDNGKGVAYKLKEETGRNLPGFYTTGKLKWRIV